MKKHSMARLFVSLAATFATTLLAAQDQNPVASNRFQSDQINAITSISENSDAASDGTTVRVKSKVMRSFHALFADATDVKWSLSDGRYYASFNQNGRLCKALFYSQGGLVYSLRFGTEKDLPRNVRELLKSTYVDYTIGVITEVDLENTKAWVVNLTDKDNLVVACVNDGVLNELHHYKTHP